MSDHIPFEVQSEIIKRLPVKSVIRCMSVSKEWKFLIYSSEFIRTYNICKTQKQHHLFVRYKLPNNEQVKYVSIVDDDTFPNHKSPLTVPHPVSLLRYVFTLNSVNGLLCFYGLFQHSFNDKMEKIAILWNPSIRKSVGIPISNYFPIEDGCTYIGFGVCPNTSDPVFVKINTIRSRTVKNWKVEVFTLSTRVWKSVLFNVPQAFRTCDLTYDHVFVDGFIYWRAYDHMNFATQIRSNLIISFDLKNDEFGEVCLPGRLVHTRGLTLSKVYESLGLFEYYNDGDKSFCDVWIMKEGVTNFFTKMLSIKTPDTWMDCRVLDFTKNGEVVIAKFDDKESESILQVYESSSERISGVGINGCFRSFSMNSYMETLLLLDESNSIVRARR